MENPWRRTVPSRGIPSALRPPLTRLPRCCEPAPSPASAGCREPDLRRRRDARARAWRLFRRARYLLFQRRRARGPALERVAGHEILVLPGVFNPKLFRSGEFLAAAAANPALVPDGCTVLDLGTGSGAAAIAAATRGARVVAVDINPVAVDCARLNAQRNGVAARVDVRHGDLFGPVAGERFQRVLFNPPFFRGVPRDMADAAWRAPDVAERFAAGLAEHLEPRGQALVVLSSDGDAAGFLQAFRDAGLDAEPVAQRDLVNELLVLFRVAPAAATAPATPAQPATPFLPAHGAAAATPPRSMTMSGAVVLYNPPSSATRKPVLPMSLLAVGALLEGETEYVIVDGNLEPDPVDALDRAIRETGAGVLGVTVMPGPQLAHAVPHTRALKARHPHLTVVWGGYFPTQHWDVVLLADYVDYVVRGHGEYVFRDLVRALRSGGDPAALAGLAFRRADGAPATSPLAPIPDPDQLPDFPYHRVDVARYVRRTFMGSRTLPHHSSYGCPFLCNFCAVVNMVNGRWLAQSAERTAQVARRLVGEWRADAVEFYDNNFFVHEARTAEFAERILPLGIAWWGESRIDTLLRYSDRTWALMRDSGLKMVFLGAESGSDETLRRMRKGGTASTETTLAIAKKMEAYGIVPEFSFVLGNPPDPEEDVRVTLEFVRKLKRVNPQAEIVFYMYTPVPLAGELYEQARASGFRFPETLEEWISPEWQEFAQRRSAALPWISDPLRRRVRDFERVLNAYYPTATDPKLTRAWRRVLRAVSAWRYHLRAYSYPLELQALHHIVAYQRPETSGF